MDPWATSTPGYQRRAPYPRVDSLPRTRIVPVSRLHTRLAQIGRMWVIDPGRQLLTTIRLLL